jgi:hypothetical protein
LKEFSAARGCGIVGNAAAEPASSAAKKKAAPKGG